MKLTNKKAYMAPETVTLSLELQGVTMSASQFGHEDANSETGNFHAPERKLF